MQCGSSVFDVRFSVACGAEGVGEKEQLLLAEIRVLQVIGVLHQQQLTEKRITPSKYFVTIPWSKFCVLYVEGRVLCAKCKKILEDLPAYTNHIAVHHIGKTECALCPSKVFQKSTFDCLQARRTHARTHSGASVPF